MQPSRIFLLCLTLSFHVIASLAHQPIGQGINWTKGLSWQAIQEKARRENKYIFLDCFATWCGPCKEMDKHVFSNDTVGNYMNDKFIAVKIQMDKTKNDAEPVKKWYADATAMMKQYRIQAFPTYIFLSPDGRTVHKVQGYQGVNNFIIQAQTALQPGQVYVDKYEEFDRLEKDYNSGIKHYESMLYMIQAAGELGNEDLIKQLKKDYQHYLENLGVKTLYTKEHLLFLETVALHSDSKLFTLFYQDGKKIDRIVRRKNYSKYIIDKVIYREITVPFLNIKTQARLLRGKKDTTEADWQGLHDRISAKFTKDDANRGVLLAQNTWYEQRYNFPAFYKVYLDKLDLYGIDTTNSQSPTHHTWVNFHCWGIFKAINERHLLSKAGKYMSLLVKHFHYMDYFDTYANLLYKTGEKKKALQWEKRAIARAKEAQLPRKVSNYTSVLSKMKADEPTWPIKTQ